MLDSILAAFGMYSVLPVPQRPWTEKTMKYCICFLPLVGGLIGAVQLAAFFVLYRRGTGVLLSGAVLSALPLLLSGGIHMDGFLDTCDAVHSWKGKEERLRILKDPHAGAFAVIGGLVYCTLSLGVWSEAAEETILPLCLTFVLSRGLSALTALTLPKARGDGMLRQETDPVPGGAALCMGIVSAAAAVCIVAAGGLKMLAVPAAAVLVILYYRHMALHMFGGVTGDLAGWFLQVCELVTAAVAVLL